MAVLFSWPPSRTGRSRSSGALGSQVWTMAMGAGTLNTRDSVTAQPPGRYCVESIQIAPRVKYAVPRTMPVKGISRLKSNSGLFQLDIDLSQETGVKSWADGTLIVVMMIGTPRCIRPRL